MEENKLGNVKIVNTAEFQTEVLEAEGLVLVDFFAPWCPPCKRLDPELEAVATQLGSAIKVVKLDTDKDEALSLQYNVQQVPNLTFFRNGKVLDQHVGLLLKRDILARVERLSEAVASK